MMDFAFAISVADQVDDVRLLVDILRRNWPSSVYIAVCALDAAAAGEIGRCDIDDLTAVQTISFEVEPRDPRSGQFAKTLSELDALRSVCALATGSGASHVMHLQAGSFALSWPDLLRLSNEMVRKGAVFAARGPGFGFYAPDTPVGRFDPSFFVFESYFARARRLWEFELTDALPHKVTMPGFLALWGLARIGVRRFWRYSDLGGDCFTFDPVRKFLHVGALHPDLAGELKAAHFIEHRLTRGPAIERLLARWGSHLVASERRDKACLPDGSEGSLLQRPDWLQRWIYRYRYGDMVWPGRVDDIYRAMLKGTTETPPELRDVSFDMS